MTSWSTRRRAVAVLSVLAAVSGTVAVGGPAQAASGPLTSWTNAMILPFTVGPDRAPYSIRFIGVGPRRDTTQEIYGCTGRGPEKGMIEVARGRKAWQYGRPSWSGVVYRTTVDAQHFEYVGQRMQTRGHFGSASALVGRIRHLLATKRATVVHAVGGDRSSEARKARARDDALNISGVVQSEVERAREAYDQVARRTDPTPPIDPMTLPLADRSVLHAWDAANGIRWSWLSRSTWTAELPKAWRKKASCGEGLGDSRYHREVTVSGTGAAWTVSLRDVEDDFVVTETSAPRR